MNYKKEPFQKQLSWTFAHPFAPNISLSKRVKHLLSGPQCTTSHHRSVLTHSHSPHLFSGHTLDERASEASNYENNSRSKVCNCDVHQTLGPIWTKFCTHVRGHKIFVHFVIGKKISNGFKMSAIFLYLKSNMFWRAYYFLKPNNTK